MRRDSVVVRMWSGRAGRVAAGLVAAATALSPLTGCTAAQRQGQSSSLLVIDSLSDLRFAAPDDKRFEEYTYTLTQRLSRRGITTLMTVESAPVFGLAQLPGTALSSLSDNIVLLGYQLDGGQVQRVIHVLKSRASNHDPAIRRLTISDSGVSIGDPVAV